MAKYLLIVESPAKAKTIAGYLKDAPDEWVVLATGGHIEDLPRNEYGVEYHHGHYQGRWRLKGKKDKVIQRIREAKRGADGVYIASDDDREGERIARDIIKHAKIDNPLRITFTEITKDAIQQAILHGIRPLHDSTVESQEARRLIDRVVGYPMSAIIRWHFRVMKRHVLPSGIGRVISPALNILGMNEKAIEEFVPESYEQIVVDYSHRGQQFRLTNNLKYKPEAAAEMEAALHAFRTSPHVVENYKRITNEVRPYPPFITARLQRAAFYLFRFEPDYTMKLAQELYEGVDTPWGRTGMITYPRTDSYHLSDHAVDEMIAILTDHYGEEADEYVLMTKRQFENKTNAQAAHEAIRPTHFSEEYWPGVAQQYLTEDQTRLYEMIFYRTMSTQVRNALYDMSILEVDVGGNKLIGRAYERLFDGWERLDGHRINIAERNDDPNAFKYREVVLPEFDVGDELRPLEITTVEGHTKTPPRYGVGRFITTLDNKGIGRPSTLDTVIPNLEKKKYVKVAKGMLHVTQLGMDVNDWTTEHASWLNDLEESKRFEEQLDAVEHDKQSRDELIEEYTKRVAEVKQALGYQDMSERPPSQNQLTFAARLAREAGVTLTDEDVRSAASISKFISKYKKPNQEIGKCPVCKTHPVVAYEKVYQCTNKECGFRVWKKSVENFLERYHPEYQDADALVTDMLRRKKTRMDDLTGKNGNRFSAYYAFEAREHGNGYGISRVGWARKTGGTKHE
ncbi:type IA DNA topoisomerase [Thiolapillus sp.]|uniref:type IA DNA topoisomerase n=1 Tax=Thiolapillus sp. TaxID=2017437 RepID=UPI003AF8E7A1